MICRPQHAHGHRAFGAAKARERRFQRGRIDVRQMGVPVADECRPECSWTSHLSAWLLRVVLALRACPEASDQLAGVTLGPGATFPPVISSRDGRGGSLLS
jgi:hypothetical protein